MSVFIAKSNTTLSMAIKFVFAASILIFVRTRQPSNAPFPIILRLLGKVTFNNVLQSKKEYEPIVIIAELLGKVMFVKRSHLENA